MTALDASLLIALLNVDDAHHGRSIDLITLVGDPVVHRINLAEALVAPVRAGRADEAARAWTTVGITELEAGTGESLELARLRVESRLKVPDCCALLAAEHAGGRLVTFDDRLARAARSRGLEVLGADA